MNSSTPWGEKSRGPQPGHNRDRTGGRTVFGMNAAQRPQQDHLMPAIPSSCRSNHQSDSVSSARVAAQNAAATHLRAPDVISQYLRKRRRLWFLVRLRSVDGYSSPRMAEQTYKFRPKICCSMPAQGALVTAYARCLVKHLHEPDKSMIGPRMCVQ